MSGDSKVVYEFGPFRADPEKQRLLRDNQVVALTPKTFETLLVLLRHSREVVSKDELMKELWPDAFVEEANLSQNIFMLRKALGDSPEERRYIVTLPGKGYRFAAEVRMIRHLRPVQLSPHTPRVARTLTASVQSGTRVAAARGGEGKRSICSRF